MPQFSQIPVLQVQVYLSDKHICAWKHYFRNRNVLALPRVRGNQEKSVKLLAYISIPGRELFGKKMESPGKYTETQKNSQLSLTRVNTGPGNVTEIVIMEVVGLSIVFSHCD